MATSPTALPTRPTTPDDLQVIADRIVAHVTDAGEGVEANVRVERTRHGLTRFANSFVHQHVGEDTVAVALTVAVEGRTSSASTTAIDDEALARLVHDTVEAARQQPVDPHWPGATPATPTAGTGTIDAATAEADPDARAAVVRDFVDAADDLRAAGFVDTELSQVAVASTAGQRAAGQTSRATLDGIHQTDTSAGAAHATSIRLADLDGASLGAQAADRARRSASFVDLEPGRYEVVLAPEAVATVLTFLSVYGFNAKAHLEGASFARLGEDQFDPAITIVDDPTDARRTGLPFDAEGTPKQRTVLVDAGRTTALAHDRRTAARSETTSTGHAIPGGAGIGAVPTDVTLQPGTTPLDELIAGVERGLFVTQFHYVRILDPKSSVATGLTRNGTFLVEDGEIVGAVGNLRFTQSFLDALAPGAVTGVGDDARYAHGEFGPGMVICPSLRLASWNFTGGAKG
ncbi:MAG: TldD/PmbA family protein [Nitriliruptoraceae bacterium]|nr:TldD/PmbA family protein [Nitriliruptoraceae bacterium]